MPNNPTSVITDGIAGPYTVTFSGQDLGVLEDAIQIEYTPAADLFGGDNLGDTVQDGVYRGTSGVFVSMVLQQYSAAGALGAFWPWNPTIYDVGLVGDMLRQFAADLVLTRVTGTSAVPATLTATAILAPGTPVTMLYGNRLRNVPLRFLILPRVVSGPAVRFFSVT